MILRNQDDSFMSSFHQTTVLNNIQKKSNADISDIITNLKNHRINRKYKSPIIHESGDYAKASSFSRYIQPDCYFENTNPKKTSFTSSEKDIVNIYASKGAQFHRPTRNSRKYSSFISAPRQIAGRHNIDSGSRNNKQQTYTNKRSLSCMRSSFSNNKYGQQRVEKIIKIEQERLGCTNPDNVYYVTGSNKNHLKTSQKLLIEQSKKSLAQEQVNALPKNSESLEEIHYCLVRFRQRMKRMLYKVEVKATSKKDDLQSIVPLDELYYEDNY